MIESLAKILPPILIFFIGYFLKRIGLLKKDDANLFLRLCFYIGFPSIYLLSIPDLHLSTNLIPLVIAPIVVIFSTYFLALCTARLLKLKRTPFGVFLLACMLMNGTFLFPFFLSIYGLRGIATYSFFDLSGALLTFSFTYSLACLYGERIKGMTFIFKKLLLSPPIWGIVIGILLNYLQVQLPLVITNTLQDTANLVTPLFMLSLGIHFHFTFSNFRLIIPAILIRSLGGFLVGLTIVTLFHMEGLPRIVTLIYSAAPVGLNTLVFSTLEKLDIEFAANIVSLSVLLGLIFVPFLFLVIK
jgi:predicted permease